jgi:antagonist of KipI
VKIIEVIDGGFFTTVQDLGRYGYQRYGVPVSGAMDLFAVRAANLLVGNSDSAAALEMTLLGPRVRFLADTVIAITGGNLQPQLDDRPAPLWRAFVAPEGAVLQFGGAVEGLRAYLAVARGVDVPIVLGSRSTFTRGQLGGFDGRALRAGDVLSTLESGPFRVDARAFPREHIPTYGRHHAVRVILGPQDDAFTREGLSTFLAASYVVTPKSDRIGCRLEGPVVTHAATPDIISDGTPFGAVQVAGDGVPIVLMADRGTTGGYTKVATVISADMPMLAQAVPGDRVSFRAVPLEAAHLALEQQERILERIASSRPVVFARKRLRLRVGATSMDVTTGLVEQEMTDAMLAAGTTTIQAIGETDSETFECEITRLPDLPQ